MGDRLLNRKLRCVVFGCTYDDKARRLLQTYGTHAYTMVCTRCGTPENLEGSQSFL